MVNLRFATNPVTVLIAGCLVGFQAEVALIMLGAGRLLEPVFALQAGHPERVWTYATHLFAHKDIATHLLPNVFFLALGGGWMAVHGARRQVYRVFLGAGVLAGAATMAAGVASQIGASGGSSALIGYSWVIVTRQGRPLGQCVRYLFLAPISWRRFGYLMGSVVVAASALILAIQSAKGYAGQLLSESLMDGRTGHMSHAIGLILGMTAAILQGSQSLDREALVATQSAGAIR